MNTSPIKPISLAQGLVLLVLVALFIVSEARGNADADQSWEVVTTSNGSVPVARHESSSITINGQLYLMGGRGLKSVDRYDPVANTWTSLSDTPIEIHHFQPVLWGDRIYVLGAMACCYPNEPSVGTIYIYDPATDTWTTGDEIPETRQRGGAAAVTYQGKIYLIGGNTQGHSGGHVAWLDSYDPATGVWTELADAPNARDHFYAVVIDEKLVVAGGRQSQQPNVFANTIAAVDIFNFATQTWSSSSESIPTERAGAMVVAYDEEAIVIGGEVASSSDALNNVEAFNVITNQWRSLQPLLQGRHSGGAGILGNELHVFTGSIKKGGGAANETTHHEKLQLQPGTPAPEDSDGDGLNDDYETNISGTDPDKPDSDFDGLNDGTELQIGTDPLDNDSDNDSLLDGDELNQYQTAALLQDTDADGLNDGDEVLLHLTDPNDADSDDDGISDGDEIDASLAPLDSDSDDDGLTDGDELVTYGTDPADADSDGDSLTDGEELNQYQTNPLLSDTDEDGMDDATEIANGRDPLVADDTTPDPNPNPDQEPVPDPDSEQDSGNSGGGGLLWILLLPLLVMTVYRESIRKILRKSFQKLRQISHWNT